MNTGINGKNQDNLESNIYISTGLQDTQNDIDLHYQTSSLQIESDINDLVNDVKFYIERNNFIEAIHYLDKNAGFVISIIKEVFG